MEKKKLKVGVFGVGRGSSLMAYCGVDPDTDLVAICDKDEEKLTMCRRYLQYTKVVLGAKVGDITYYTNFEDFIKHDMDVVILANYANEHAVFAVKCLRAGKNVISEVLPCQNLKEAVELIETIEETGLTYCYAENYCYMAAPHEMRKLYREGRLGELEYAEGEYIHNCETIWPSITYGEADHWRNNMFATFYCTHSIGPIVHATGLRPVKVMGFITPFNDQCFRAGSRAPSSGMEVMTMENGAIVRSNHGGLKVNSVWYSMQGTKGAMETEREFADDSRGCHHLYTYLLPEDNSYLEPNYPTSYDPKDELEEKAEAFGHGGSDFRCLYNAFERIRGNEEADAIDVYEAMDMFLPGLFAHFSVVCGGREQEIPNLRLKSERDKWRNDTRCTDPKAAGDMLLPTMPGGTPEIPAEVYKKIEKMWRDDFDAQFKKTTHDEETGWAEDIARMKEEKEKAEKEKAEK